MAITEGGLGAPSPLYRIDDIPLWVKDERQQPSGSFKVRGAFQWLRANSGGGPIVTASSGNHALALSWALGAMGDSRDLMVMVTADADPAKIAELRREGCDIRVCTGDNHDRDEHARELAASVGGTYCSSHDDPLVIAGQSGVVEEILEQRPATERVYVPVGGGGLLAGSLLATRGRPGVHIIGVQPAGAASMSKSLEVGHRYKLDSVHTVCDGLRAVVPGALCFDIAQEYGARVMVVDEAAVIETRVALCARLGDVEASGAVGVAGALAADDLDAVCVVTGGSSAHASSAAAGRRATG